jgi:two-component system, OmpR family, catabolic regulation response regulator CreB
MAARIVATAAKKISAPMASCVQSGSQMLAVLVRRPGRVFSREELLQRVWTDPGASTDRSVDSHVKALRAKLREVRPELEAIATHRGQGYSLREQW